MHKGRAGAVRYVTISVQRICSVFTVSERGKKRLSKPFFERSPSASGIKRTHDCKRPKCRDGRKCGHIPAGSVSGYIPYGTRRPGRFVQDQPLERRPV